ncbi:putative hydrolase of the HAD superfamily [Salipaludibacillus aurantiacus]|uniref:Putative hydrolase of the HAD superfamily n=2 Tax=Salipaludibacillus aurantiacus TaxID=1601833 RepID=A0A1H9R9A6_9BACI|nr:putative hydrolase of the HAD superfamily [Salipaludibacillus aurantiacus]
MDFLLTQEGNVIAFYFCVCLLLYKEGNHVNYSFNNQFDIINSGVNWQMDWKAVTFDLDNTLFSHEEAFKKAIKECFKTFSDKYINEAHEITYEQFFPVFKLNCDRYWDKYESGEVDGKTYRRIRFNETMKDLALPYGNDYADFFHDHYYSIIDEYSKPFEGVHELFEVLTEHGVRIAIVSNGSADTQYNKVKKLGINKWVADEHIFISEEAGVSKPDKEIFKLVEEKLKLPSHDIVFVGDSWEHDVAGPIEAGWEAIFLNTRKEDKPTEHQPAAEFEEFTHLKDELIKMVRERRAL